MGGYKYKIFWNITISCLIINDFCINMRIKMSHYLCDFEVMSNYSIFNFIGCSFQINYC